MITLVLAGLFWMAIASSCVGQVLAVKEKRVRRGGQSRRRAELPDHHAPPSRRNCIGPIMVNATLAIAAAIVSESTLSYLGFGVQPAGDVVGQHALRTARSVENNTHLLYFPTCSSC